MKIHKRDILELTIDKMAYGGRGIARMDGFVIFVKGGVPGDRLTAQIFFESQPDRFLHMYITDDDRWDKLCKFLDVPVPDTPFPHENRGK